MGKKLLSQQPLNLLHLAEAKKLFCFSPCQRETNHELGRKQNAWQKPTLIFSVPLATPRETYWQSLSDQPPMDDQVVDANALADVAAALCGP